MGSAVALLVGLWPVVALAGDGAMEINQACAVNTGCFPGDAPGFPVDISQPGSYVLTGDLDHHPAVHGSTDIVHLVDDVSLDLRGFSMRSTTTCSAGGACPLGSVNGIDGLGVSRASVRNGRVIGVDGTCIGVLHESHVEDVAVSHCGSVGIVVGSNSIVSDSRITSTGRTGLLTNTPTLTPSGTLYRNCTFAKNGLRGETLFVDILASVDRYARATGPNSCDDGLCGQGRRRYYLTQTAYDGDEVLGVCAPGFHEATLHEIVNPSALEYDTRRGRTHLDSGSGPPSGIAAWVRTGYDLAQVVAGPGRANCGLWSSDTIGEFGSIGQLEDSWLNTITNSAISPWTTFSGDCSFDNPVWCVED